MFFNDITQMTTGGLKSMHRAIRDRLIEEDQQSQSDPKIYGVRQYKDWREQADEMEAELSRRGESFPSIPW